jgi:hypothetical protein
MQARRLVDLAQEAVLADEAPDLWVVEAGLCEEEARLLVPDVAGEGEAVLGGLEFFWEPEVAPDCPVRRDSVVPDRLIPDAVFDLAAQRTGRESSSTSSKPLTRFFAYARRRRRRSGGAPFRL